MNVLPKIKRCGTCKCRPLNPVRYKRKVFCDPEKRPCLKQYKEKEVSHVSERRGNQTQNIRGG
jgi:hypothetical protein